MATEHFQVKTSDGITLFGNYFSSSKENPFVLLLHQFNSTKESWSILISDLQKNGFNILALDLRGHGESNKEKNVFLMRDQDFRNMELDIAAVKQKFNLKNFFIIGSSIGANTALNYAIKDSDVKGIVLLSPGIEYKGISVEGKIEKYSPRPVFLVASEEDSYSANTIQLLYDQSSSKNKKIEMLDRAGHGTFMLTAKPKLGKEIIDWMKEVK